MSDNKKDNKKDIYLRLEFTTNQWGNDRYLNLIGTPMVKSEFESEYAYDKGYRRPRDWVNDADSAYRYISLTAQADGVNREWYSLRISISGERIEWRTAAAAVKVLKRAEDAEMRFRLKYGEPTFAQLMGRWLEGLGIAYCIIKDPESPVADADGWRVLSHDSAIWLMEDKRREFTKSLV